ncbi:lysophospholipase [Curvivirga sp.]|uniref:alpha/beta hydrolase n=1 Tax=Curvivirga sp. TaxID=2856848 RepID=UPI003B5AA9F2
MWARIHKVFLFIFALKVISACSPTLQTISEINQKPELHDDKIITKDGFELPLKVWKTDDLTPKAVILALHGFNDHANGWDQAATIWAENGLWTYAYDQRGFGATEQRGLWAGEETYIDDVKTAITLLKEKHPETPIYLAGHSMGGAITLLTATSEHPPEVDGYVLVAPAVLYREDVPWIQRVIVEATLAIAPGWTPTIHTDKIASDNREMLIKMFEDPLFIKRSRVDTGYFLFELMMAAGDKAKTLDKRTLILYGDKEEIVPPYAVERFLKQLPQNSDKSWSLKRYKDGYHMLTRDLNGDKVSTDIAKYILENSAL